MPDLKNRTKRGVATELGKTPEQFIYIHYASEELGSLGPRVASVAVRVHDGDTTVFDIPTSAQKLRLEKNEIREKLDDIERVLLSDLFEFIHMRRDRSWIHWRMDNTGFGFAHLENRFRTSNKGAEPPKIDVTNRHCLKTMLSDWYGNDFAPHPKMDSLREINGLNDPEFLTGEEECAAFRNGSYLEMSMSTQHKVRLFEDLLNLAVNNELKTADSSGTGGLQRLWRPLALVAGRLMGGGSQET